MLVGNTLFSSGNVGSRFWNRKLPSWVELLPVSWSQYDWVGLPPVSWYYCDWVEYCPCLFVKPQSLCHKDQEQVKDGRIFGYTCTVAFVHVITWSCVSVDLVHEGAVPINR